MTSPFYDQFKPPVTHPAHPTPIHAPGADRDIIERLRTLVHESLELLQRGDIVGAREALEDAQSYLEEL